MTTSCARILIYEHSSSVCLIYEHSSSVCLSVGIGCSASHGAATVAPKSDSITLIPQAAGIDQTSTSQVTTFPTASDEVDQQASQ
jgi:hypothetical protein